MWTPLGHVARKYSGGQKLLTQELKIQMNQAQVLQKSITSNCHHFINNDPYYDNHDPDLDIDNDWF